MIDNQIIGNQIRNLSQTVHLTATGDNVHLGRILHRQLVSYGLEVIRKNYSVLVSSLNYAKPNKILLQDSTGTTVFAVKYRGKNDEFHVEYSPFSSWSPSGVASGKPVYANFGRERDFRTLKSLNISVKSNIVIIRYKRHFPTASAVRNAVENEAAGVLLYPDPAQFTDMFHDHLEAYPKSKWLPSWAVVRSQLSIFMGDLLTPDLPAITGMQRKSIEECKNLLPSIPCQPISFSDAEILLSNMAGSNNFSVPIDFIGGLNISYNIGPGYDNEKKNFSIYMQTNNEMLTRNISNVLAIIWGSEESDRYVIIGNHYDAWLTGAVDPISGTAILQEISRSLGERVKSGWKPRRTIIIAHWDAAMQGYLGSVEWIQEFKQELEHNSVMYIDVSTPVTGNYTMEATANPILHELLWESLRQSEPWNNSTEAKSAYDLWLKRCRLKDERNRPEIWSLESNDSDRDGFVFILGIPSCHLQLAPERGSGDELFPSHTTATDTYNYVSKFVDNSFMSHKSYAQIILEILFRTATVPKLPFRITKLGKYLEKEYQRLQLNIESKNLLRKFPLDIFQNTLLNFIKSAEAIDFELESTPDESTLRIRQLNDQLMSVSRAFIWSEDIPGHLKGQRNVLFGRTFRGNSVFPGIFQTFHDYVTKSTDENAVKVNRQISIVSYCLKAADSIIQIH
ncbi:DgyrCDS4306 [Dimorphilus gyrociliatus]|uniref:DgyrCDS4306 n=1 Tax=Dimorphilus gyrociliatus TaxID=2664684 RepID=A0A7I8VH55_9ANNE|nr:DgyrCDS4306 [Dimorphilus gyrociliatus]